MQNFVNKIDILAKQINRHIVLMELCGTHTEAVARHGIKKLLPKNIKLLSGPGCPVCVTDQKDIDAVIVLALEGIPIACYGDVLRVPGTLIIPNTKYQIPNTGFSLDKARELGADVTEVYSIEDALKLQKKKPNLVFFGIGFETTTPMTAIAIKHGLTVYSSHKAFVPAMEALLNTPNLKIDGFINPGHVSTVIGVEPYRKLKVKNQKPKELSSFSKGAKLLKVKGIPQVIAGFEAEDVLIAIYMLLKQISENRAEVENEYTRSVRPEGNPKALKLINEVFELKDTYWRGLGKIPNSGFEIRPKYSQFDAKVKYKELLYNSHSERSEESRTLRKGILIPRDSSLRLRGVYPEWKQRVQNDISSGCICGAILRGLKEPQDCKLFNKKCTQENPVGACMVSSEGACGIEAKYNE